MHAIKFKAQIKNGRLDVPQAYQYLESRTIEVILCTEESPANACISDDELHKNWKKLVAEGLSGLDDAGCKIMHCTEVRDQYRMEKYQ